VSHEDGRDHAPSLIAVAQRFKVRNVRIGLLVVAGVLFTYDIVSIASLPRL
jgi:hypothetical protein